MDRAIWWRSNTRVEGAIKYTDDWYVPAYSSTLLPELFISFNGDILGESETEPRYTSEYNGENL